MSPTPPREASPPEADSPPDAATRPPDRPPAPGTPTRRRLLTVAGASAAAALAGCLGGEDGDADGPGGPTVAVWNDADTSLTVELVLDGEERTDRRTLELAADGSREFTPPVAVPFEVTVQVGDGAAVSRSFRGTTCPEDRLVVRVRGVEDGRSLVRFTGPSCR